MNIINKLNVKPIVFSAVFITGLFASGCNISTPIQSLPSDTEQEQVDYFANDALGNALAVVQHPAGVHQDGVTYVSYQGPLEDPYVAAYNHITNTWQGPIKAGVSEMGKDPTRKKKIDNHGKPTMLIDDLGYIHIFFGGHGGIPEKHGKNPLGDTHYGENKHVVSKNPRDISSWEELDTISVFGTYNQAVKMDNGDIYLFYRHGAHRSDWVYQKSTDHGRSFSPPVSFLKFKRRTDIKAVDSWYAWVSKGEGDDIIISFDYHVCWDNGAGINGRGHTTERHDAYFMTFNTKNNTWRNVHNETLALPVTREVADAKALVARTGQKWTFNGSAKLDANGFAHIATNIGKDLGEKTGGPKQTSHFRWTGDQWVGGNPVNPQTREENVDARGDFFIDEQGNITFALGYQEKGDGIIAYYTSKNNGETFTKGKELLRKPGATWALTALITNAHPDARLIVAEKQKGDYWRKIYLLGDNGPIKRKKQDALVLKKKSLH